MALRIKELCKQKHTTLAEIAKQIKWKDKDGEHIGISPVSLTQSLNGNPTLSRLQEVASILGVDVSELFVPPIKESVFGCLYIKGKPIVVNSKEEVLKILETVD